MFYHQHHHHRDQVPHQKGARPVGDVRPCCQCPAQGVPPHSAGSQHRSTGRRPLPAAEGLAVRVASADGIPASWKASSDGRPEREEAFRASPRDGRFVSYWTPWQPLHPVSLHAGTSQGVENCLGRSGSGRPPGSARYGNQGRQAVVSPHNYQQHGLVASVDPVSSTFSALCYHCCRQDGSGDEGWMLRRLVWQGPCPRWCSCSGAGQGGFMHLLSLGGREPDSIAKFWFWIENRNRETILVFLFKI